jgi:chromosome segregation ATPase
MSILTTLALMTTALRAAVGREQQAYMKTRAALWPELDGSAAELAKAKDEVAELEAKLADARRERDDWQARAEAWRARAEPPPQMQENAQYLQQLQTLAQQNTLAAQQHQLQNAQVYCQLLGAQGLQMPGEWCNCVPARHDMFLNGNGA